MFKHELRIILVLYRIYFLSLLINIYLNRSIFCLIFWNIFQCKPWSASKSKYQKLENCRFRSSNMFNFRSYIPLIYKKIVCFSKNTCVIISQSWGRITALANNKNKKKRKNEKQSDHCDFFTFVKNILTSKLCCFIQYLHSQTIQIAFKKI